MKGTIKFFNEAKGFGFIVGEDGKEVFVHKSSLDEGMVLNENDTVTFDVEDGDKGPKAVNVKKSEAGAEEAPAEEKTEEPAAEEEAPAEEKTEEPAAEEETPAEEKTEEPAAEEETEEAPAEEEAKEATE